MRVRKHSRKVKPRHKPRATSNDVLGVPQRNNSVPKKWRPYYRRLVQLREELARRQAHLANDALEEKPSFSLHMADAATDMNDRDMALSMLSTEQDALYQVEQALDRIVHRTYGVCELTGKPIETARLQAIPWTRFSAAAEKQLERDGATGHAQLARRRELTLESVTEEATEPDVEGEEEEEK